MLDPARLAYVALLHWEGDENGGMDRFLADAKEAELIGSALSITAQRAGLRRDLRVRGFTTARRSRWVATRCASSRRRTSITGTR